MYSKICSKKWLIAIILLSNLVVFHVISQADPIVIDHASTDITIIPQYAIENAKNTLHIAYGHTSHGSQLTEGMAGLVDFANGGGLGLSLPDNIFAWNNGGTGGALDLHDYAMGDDVGYYPQWVNNTRAYLDNPQNAHDNVIIWSWCGQVSSKYATGTLVSEYLSPMAQLESEYPHVKFVYMTGHVDIWADANNKAANQMIRDYCIANDKILYDFADIERYDPDGTYYEFVHDSCDYYNSPAGSIMGNWAIEWQNTHTQGVDWYTCGSAHSEPLNANRKAYAAWWLWATLAGWNQTGVNRAPVLQPIGDKAVEWSQTLAFSISATDMDVGDALTYQAATLPTGAMLNGSSGTFSWSPSNADEGDHTVTFTVVDDRTPQGSDSETITITVYSPYIQENHNPILDPIGDHQIECGQELYLAITASDLDSSDLLTLSAAPLPDGAIFAHTTGIFIWTPITEDQGDHVITFSVTDDRAPNGSDEEMVTISVITAESTPQNDNNTGDSDRRIEITADTTGCFIDSLK